MPGEMDSRHPWRSGLRPVGKADAQIGYPCRFVELHRSNSLPTAHIRQNPHKGGFVVYGPPGEIRTPDTQVRSLVLYPAELRAEACSIGNSVNKRQRENKVRQRIELVHIKSDSCSNNKQCP